MTPLDPYVVQQAACLASLLVSAGCFRRDDWEDLRQELILDFLRRAPKFDPTRGDWRGFVRGVVRNQAKKLITRGLRRAQREVLIKDVLTNEETPEDDSIDVLTDRQWHRDEEVLQMRSDVVRVLAAVSPQLRALAYMLSESPLIEVCANTGKSRSRLYQMIRQLREVFIRAGIRPCRPRKSTREAVKQSSLPAQETR